MDQQNFQECACKARELYRITQCLQKIMLDLFFEEFCKLDEQEEKEKLLRCLDILPF